jgi:excisionase family DNA binding protein
MSNNKRFGIDKMSVTNYEETDLQALRTEIQELKSLLTTQFSQPYLSRLQVCDLLGITLPTVNDWAKRGILIAYRLGNRIYFKPNEIDKSLQRINENKEVTPC